MYQILKGIAVQYGSVSKLKQVHHRFSSQKNEALNQKVATVAPKTKTFSKSMSLDDRVAFVVACDSNSRQWAFETICRRLVVDVAEATLEFLRRSDNKAKYWADRQRKRATKLTRSKVKTELRKKAILDDKKGKKAGLTYETGVALQEPEAGEEENNIDENGASKKKRKASNPSKQSKKKKQDKSTIQCKHCGRYGHQRITSHECEKNPLNIARKQREEEKGAFSATFSARFGMRFRRKAQLDQLTSVFWCFSMCFSRFLFSPYVFFCGKGLPRVLKLKIPLMQFARP